MDSELSLESPIAMESSQEVITEVGEQNGDKAQQEKQGTTSSPPACYQPGVEVAAIDEPGG